jgi:hypothetical protein
MSQQSHHSDDQQDATATDEPYVIEWDEQATANAVRAMTEALEPGGSQGR